MFRDDTHMTSIVHWGVLKTVQFSRTSRPPPCPKFFHPITLNVQFQTTSPPFSSPSPNNQSIKRKHNPRWLLYVIRYFLQISFHFQYQLIINLIWLSIDFSSFSNFKKLRISFSPFSYSEKTRWGQGWAEASLSTFSWLYILVCAVVKKYHEMFS